MDSKPFKLISLTPIGFKEVNYPITYCTICRGYLTEVCGDCLEKKCEKCEVNKFNDTYYHVHCYKLTN